jgi:asparagine synthetase B (glutamine-hydrolysing)
MSKYRPDSQTFTLGTPGSDDTPIAEQVARETGLSHHYWELSTSYIAEMGETYSYLVDGMDGLSSMDEFPLSVRVGDYVDVSVGGLLGGPMFGYYMDPVSANLRKEDVKKYFLWRNTDGGISQLLEQVFGIKKGQEFSLMAIDSLNKCIDSAPYQRGFQIYQYITLRYNQNRSSNLAQLAKLAFVDIYHPLTDKDVVAAAAQLPANQLVLEQAYRRAMVTHFPELGKILWTYTLTPLSISTPAAVLKKTAQHTLGQWLRKTPLGNHSLIRPRRYYTNHYQWSCGPLRTFIEETLLSPEANAAGLFNADGLRTVIREHMEGKRSATVFIVQALAAALWTRLFYTPSTPVRPGSL